MSSSRHKSPSPRRGGRRWRTSIPNGPPTRTREHEPRAFSRRWRLRLRLVAVPSLCRIDEGQDAATPPRRAFRTSKLDGPPRANSSPARAITAVPAREGPGHATRPFTPPAAGRVVRRRRPPASLLDSRSERRWARAGSLIHRRDLRLSQLSSTPQPLMPPRARAHVLVRLGAAKHLLFAALEARRASCASRRVEARRRTVRARGWPAALRSPVPARAGRGRAEIRPGLVEPGGGCAAPFCPSLSLRLRLRVRLAFAAIRLCAALLLLLLLVMLIPLDWGRRPPPSCRSLLGSVPDAGGAPGIAVAGCG